MATITALTEASFDDTISSDVPVLVDFWAEWCAPCRAVAPILEEIAGEKGEQLKVVKLNVDENPGVAQRLSILSIPTLILFAKGRELARVVGARAKEQLLRDIEPHLA